MTSHIYSIQKILPLSSFFIYILYLIFTFIFVFIYIFKNVLTPLLIVALKKSPALLVNLVSVIPQASSRLKLSACLNRRSFPLIGEGGTVLAGQGVLSAVTGGVVVLGVGLSWQRKTHLFHCLDLEGMWWFDLAAQRRGVREGTSEDPVESCSIHPQKVKRDWVLCPSRELPPKNCHSSSPGAQGKRQTKRGY